MVYATDKELLKSIIKELRSRESAIKKNEEISRKRIKTLSLLFLTVLLVFFSLSCAQAGQYTITHDKAVKSIIGEAEGESFQGKLAIACGIRNRGHLKGVYGLYAKRVQKHQYSNKVQKDATNAWNLSQDRASCAFIKGSSYWEGTAFKTPYWAKNMELVAVIGNQRFYRK